MPCCNNVSGAFWFHLFSQLLLSALECISSKLERSIPMAGLVVEVSEGSEQSNKSKLQLQVHDVPFSNETTSRGRMLLILEIVTESSLEASGHLHLPRARIHVLAAADINVFSSNVSLASTNIHKIAPIASALRRNPELRPSKMRRNICCGDRREPCA